MRTFLNTLRPQLARAGWLFIFTVLASGCASTELMNSEADSREIQRSTHSDDFTYRTTLGAHRGDSVIHIENTLSAIRSAREATVSSRNF